MPATNSSAKKSIAFLCYRGNPYSGGQGVYTRYLCRELVELGYDVTVFAGQPWPILDPEVKFEKVPSLDLYRRRWPFWWPYPWQLKTTIDWREWGLSMTGQFPEARTFSQRIERRLTGRLSSGEFDLIHDNQCLGEGLLPLVEEGWPLVATIHHPITVDYDLELQHATTRRQRFFLNRWYSFLAPQIEVAKQLPHVITVSENSKRDIAQQMGVPAERMEVVPVGVDETRFRPLPHIKRVPGRLLTTASGDVPLKGLTYLLEAVAKARTERPDVHLVVIGKLRGGSVIPGVIERLGISDAVEFVSGVSDERIVELYAECELAVVPSLYEGFSLPAIEAMASGATLLATTGGAIPEVVGTSGDTARLVPPADAGALAQAIVELLDDPEERERLAVGGRERVFEKLTWKRCAEGTAAVYDKVLGGA
ncbi:MAG TPA: glycosyltransferase family 4 protein [Acidimicrobiales bacterium]|nr:glycosyltransferase family 4 protein [Acidimicrobiales bacterium]